MKRVLALTIVLIGLSGCKPTSSEPDYVTPGGYCDSIGSQGQSESGVTYVCKGPEPLRWRR